MRSCDPPAADLDAHLLTQTPRCGVGGCNVKGRTRARCQEEEPEIGAGAWQGMSREDSSDLNSSARVQAPYPKLFPANEIESTTMI